MSNSPSPQDRLLDLFERMLTIRRAEERLAQIFRDGRIPGFIHLSIGQEATAVGVAAALKLTDTIASTHRGHGHALAKGMSPESLFQEILGNVEGPCRGRGGSLHVADFSVGMLGANGIVGAGVPIALGSALAHKTLGNSHVAAVFFGDGALAEGVVYEALNLSALWALPLLLVCENNGWSEFSPTSIEYAGRLEALAGSFSVSYKKVDGNDVEAVLGAADDLVALLRAGRGPAVLECMTKRIGGHYEGDPQAYRIAIQEQDKTDPIEIVKMRLRDMKTPHSLLDDVANRVSRLIETASEATRSGHAPEFEAARTDVYA